MIGFFKDTVFYARMRQALIEHFGRDEPLLSRPNIDVRRASSLLRKGGMNPTEAILALVLAGQTTPSIGIHFPLWGESEIDYMRRRGAALVTQGFIRPEMYAVLTDNVPQELQTHLSEIGLW
ncbi:MAG: hypothetical protein ABIP34_13305 [Rhodoferax sp.]|uniref:hypothetical protein n=1 Tax=Rhodoferax sp. TaxID=50421 RepID=UPI0032638AD0